MNISVFAHIMPDTTVEASLRTDKDGTYLVLRVGDLTVFIRDRQKALEIASSLEQAAQKREGEAARRDQNYQE